MQNLTCSKADFVVTILQLFYPKISLLTNVFDSSLLRFHQAQYEQLHQSNDGQKVA